MKNEKKRPSDGVRQLKKAGYVLVGDTLWANPNTGHGWLKLSRTRWQEVKGCVLFTADTLEEAERLVPVVAEVAKTKAGGGFA